MDGTLRFREKEYIHVIMDSQDRKQTYQPVCVCTNLRRATRAISNMYDLALVDGLAKQNPQLYMRGFMVTSGMKIGVGVKKGNADMIAAVSDGLKIMQANQTQKKTFQRYGVDPSLQTPTTLLTQ